MFRQVETSAIFKSLIESGKFNVSVLSRPEPTSTYAADIKVFVSDYGDCNLAEAFKDQDAVVLSVGAAGFAQEIKFIDAAVKAGVKRFIPSEIGYNQYNAKTAELLPVFGIKIKTNEHLKAQESKGLTWTGILTWAAFDLVSAQIGLVGFNINTKEAMIVDGGNQPFSTSNLSQISNAVSAVLSKPEETANQLFYVDSFTATQNEVLSQLDTITGEKWKVTQTTTQVLKSEGQALWAKGDRSGLLSLLQVITFDEGCGSDLTKVRGLGNEKLGLPKQDLASTVAALVTGESI